MAQVKTNLFSNPTFTRVLPFALFMSFIAIDQGLRYLAGRELISIGPLFFHWLYLPKAVLTGLILLLLWRDYSEINAGDIRNLRNLMLSVGSGVLVFVLWINMDWTLGSQVAPAGFDPGKLQELRYHLGQGIHFGIDPSQETFGCCWIFQRAFLQGVSERF